MSVIQDNSITSNNIQPASGQSLTIKDEGGTASITVQTDGDLTLAENAYLGSGKGIYFDGQTTSANQLSDYEEGTYTVTASMSTSGSVSLATYTTGAYTKIGRTVHIHGFIKIGSVSSALGVLKFSLPFTCVSGLSGIASRSVIAIGTETVDFAAGTAPFAYAEEGQANMFVKVSTDDSASSNISVTGNSLYYFGGSYSAA
tara:strand:- start:5131 stop:5733 length:603 start_codon:yes stop_codon:yes gene_type:complete